MFNLIRADQIIEQIAIPRAFKFRFSEVEALLETMKSFLPASFNAVSVSFICGNKGSISP